MGDYFNHWLKMGKTVDADAEDFLRQLVPHERKWRIHVAGLRRQHARPEVDRPALQGHRCAKETVLGWMPKFEDIDWTGLEINKADSKR
jgi:phosphoenolpyruvate carboxykinase (GTP)